MRRSRGVRPVDPYPALSGRRSPPPPRLPAPTLSRHESCVLGALVSGARLMLDRSGQHAVVYRFRAGLEVLFSVSLRTLGSLLRKGAVHVVGSTGPYVHYALPARAVQESRFYAV